MKVASDCNNYRGKEARQKDLKEMIKSSILLFLFSLSSSCCPLEVTVWPGTEAAGPRRWCMAWGPGRCQGLRWWW